MCGRSKPIVPLLLPFWAMDQSRPGSEYLGGDSSAVPDHLKNAHQIQSTEFAFAAILGAGSVVTWGALEEEEERGTTVEAFQPSSGCNCSNEQQQVR